MANWVTHLMVADGVLERCIPINDSECRPRKSCLAPNESENPDFWTALDTLVSSGKIVIDRPKGSTHPKFPTLIYEVDYGYIENTSAMDGEGIDAWCGSLPSLQVNAIICTVDLWKKDSEIKLLLGCTEEEMDIIHHFHNQTALMKGLLIRR